MNSIYDMCKKLIVNDKYEKNDLLGKLDIFLLADRITKDQYLELITLMN